jgi:hypothetical protein
MNEESATIYCVALRALSILHLASFEKKKPFRYTASHFIVAVRLWLLVHALMAIFWVVCPFEVNKNLT